MLPKKIQNQLKLLSYVAICFMLFYFFFYTQKIATLVPSASNGSSRPRQKEAHLAAAPKLQKAAMVSLVRNSDLFGLRKTMREVEDRFNKKFNYPYIFLNDVPFTDEFKEGIKGMTSANVTFGTLDSESWGYPSWIDQDKAAEVRRTGKYMHAGNESYRFMCRFQSGYIYRHPLLRDLDFYWRIEPDVHYFCDLDYDPFLHMKLNKKMYGWNMAPSEYMDTIPTLWETTKNFMKEYPQHIPERNLLAWALNEKGEYNGCHFWTNFEIVDLKFYRSQAYTDYFNYLDKAGGFFYERWGDAPVHSLAVAMFLNKDQVKHFGDIGYFHPAMGFCPTGSDVKGKCVCDPNEHGEMRFACRVGWDKVN